MMRRLLLPMAVFPLLVSFFIWSSSGGRAADDPKEIKIKRAMSAGPLSITANAKIVEMDDKGKMIVLRDGNDGWTCSPGHQGIIGDDPECDDEAARQWEADWMAHRPKPTNMRPGVVYMLAGGTDWSAMDPWATSGTSIQEPPHWMILWPFDPKSSGLSDKVKTSGTWIMWARTPYAHLMINQMP